MYHADLFIGRSLRTFSSIHNGCHNHYDHAFLFRDNVWPDYNVKPRLFDKMVSHLGLRTDGTMQFALIS